MSAAARNLSPTVENRPRYETLRCTVTRRQAPPYQRFTTNYHEWPDHKGGLSGCACIHCGRTLKEVRVRINPKTGKPVRRGGIAREIALTVRDVPPVRFAGVDPDVVEAMQKLSDHVEAALRKPGGARPC